MADFIAIECRLCGKTEAFPLAQFVDLLKEAENTQINAADSGSLNLSLHVCDYCLGDEDESLRAAERDHELRASDGRIAD